MKLKLLDLVSPSPRPSIPPSLLLSLCSSILFSPSLPSQPLSLYPSVPPFLHLFPKITHICIQYNKSTEFHKITCPKILTARDDQQQLLTEQSAQELAHRLSSVTTSVIPSCIRTLPFCNLAYSY